MLSVAAIQDAIARRRAAGVPDYGPQAAPGMAVQNAATMPVPVSPPPGQSPLYAVSPLAGAIDQGIGTMAGMVPGADGLTPRDIAAEVPGVLASVPMGAVKMGADIGGMMAHDYQPTAQALSDAFDRLRQRQYGGVR